MGNAQDAEWYPGDAYCDISSADIYHSAHDYSTDLSQLFKTADTAGNKKMSAQSECATMIDPDLMIQDNVYWLWFAVWNWDYIVVNGTTTLSEDYTSLEMMQKVYDSEAVITLDELPDFN